MRPEGEYPQRAWTQSVYPPARCMGVPIVLPPVSPQPHTHLAFEGFQYAKEHGKGNAYNHRVLEAFFRDGLGIGRVDVPARRAGEVGLDEVEFRRALETRQYREAHERALQHAYEEMRVTGVPLFLIGRTVLTGVQSRETLERAIEVERRRQQAEAPAGSSCGPDGCQTSPPDTA